MEKIDLTKCNNLRYKAKIDGNDDYGRICVENADTGLAFLLSGREDCYIATWHCDMPSIDGYCGRKVTDFEIVPRDPETYKDWQVGDLIGNADGSSGMIIFRSGEFVVADIDGCRCRTCRELFDEGYCLMLTDMEEKIVEEKKSKPQDGDICYAESKDDYRSIFVFKDGVFATGFYISYGKFEKDAWKLMMSAGYAISDNNVAVFRPATEDEKQLLFDAMAKEGKRWNAEKKVVEDIPKPHEFKKGEPVLVRDNGYVWKIGVFTEMRADYFQYGAMTNGLDECGYRYCLPYNERTMHLLGTSEDYKEE